MAGKGAMGESCSLYSVAPLLLIWASTRQRLDAMLATNFDQPPPAIRAAQSRKRIIFAVAAPVPVPGPEPL